MAALGWRAQYACGSRLAVAQADWAHPVGAAVWARTDRPFALDQVILPRCRIAQLAEQLTLDQQVQGSSPCPAANLTPRIRRSSRCALGSPVQPWEKMGKVPRNSCLHLPKAVIH